MSNTVILLIFFVVLPLTLAALYLWAYRTFMRLTGEMFLDEHATHFDRMTG